MRIHFYIKRCCFVTKCSFSTLIEKILLMELKKVMIIIVSVFVTVTSLLAFFCYNLGKYSNISDSKEGSFKQL